MNLCVCRERERERERREATADVSMNEHAQLEQSLEYSKCSVKTIKTIKLIPLHFSKTVSEVTREPLMANFN